MGSILVGGSHAEGSEGPSGATRRSVPPFEWADVGVYRRKTPSSAHLMSAFSRKLYLKKDRMSPWGFNPHLQPWMPAPT